MMRKCVLVVLAGLAVLAAGLQPAALAADGPKPLAVVTVASYNESVQDVGFVGKLVGKAELANAMEAMVTSSRRAGPGGIDSRGRWASSCRPTEWTSAATASCR